MDEALQRRIQRYGWDKASTYYEGSWQEQLKPAHDKLFDFAKIEKGQKIIDVACGTGLTSFRSLLAMDNDGFVLGTDISDKMVELSTQAALQNNMQNIKFERMDAEELKLPDGEFDLGICALGLMYTPDPIKALKEMHRVLKPDGRCVIAVWGKRSLCGWADIFSIVEKRVVSEVCPMFFNLGNESMLERSLEAADFSKVNIERISTLLHYRSAEEACIAAFEGGPVALVYFKFPENVKKEVCEEYLASIEQYKNGDGYDVPGEFVIGLATK